MPYTSIDSPEAARAMIMEWAEGSYRMGRLSHLLEIMKKCRTEEQLRWVSDALSVVLKGHTRGTRKMPIPKAPAGGTPGPSEMEETHFVELDGEGAKTPAPMPSPVKKEEPAPPPAPAKVEAPKPPAVEPVVRNPPTRTIPPPQQRPAVAPAVAAAPPAPVRKEEAKSAPAEPVVRNPPTRSAPPPPRPEEAVRQPPTRNAPPPGAVARPNTRMIQPPLPTAPETLPTIDQATLPAGVNADILADILRVDQCRRIFESTHQQIEAWEVFCLVMMDGDKTRVELERILALRAVGDTLGFTEGATELFQNLLALRAKFGKLAQEVRAYAVTLQVGRFGPEITEMALGFLIASGRGREAATRWLTEPKRNIPEASGRWEGLIATAMRYQGAMIQVKAGKN